MKLNHSQLREVLDRYHDKYNRSEFIENDPICIPHQYTEKKDIEINFSCKRRFLIIFSGKKKRSQEAKIVTAIRGDYKILI